MLNLHARGTRKLTAAKLFITRLLTEENIAHEATRTSPGYIKGV